MCGLFDGKSKRSFGSRSTAALLKKCQGGDMNMENSLCRREAGTLKYTERKSRLMLNLIRIKHFNQL